jgi:hypothetical protein
MSTQVFVGIEKFKNHQGYNPSGGQVQHLLARGNSFLTN